MISILRTDTKMIPDLVTVITPLFNCEEFIEETIYSVLSQTYKDIEYIVVNDGSTDKSVAIVQSIMKSDPRILLIDNQQNQGAAAARNAAIELSKGKFVAFIDSDDLWNKDKLSFQIDFMRKNQVPFSFTSYTQFTGTETHKKTIIAPTRLTYRQELLYNHIGTSTVVFDQRTIGRVFFPNIRKRQDYGMWLKILKMGYIGYGIQKCLSKYRKRKGSISSNKIDMIRYNWKLYRQVENLNIFQSSLYLSTTILSKLFRIK